MTQATLIAPEPLKRGPDMTVPAIEPPARRPGALGSIHILDGSTADEVGRVRFAPAMSAELARRRAEGKTGWNNPDVCTIPQLETHMEERMAAGDVVGVACAAMMIWNRLNPDVSCTTTQGEKNGHTDC